MCKKAASAEHIRKYKREVYNELQEYRKRKGLGCLGPLSEVTNIPIFALYDILNCAPANVEQWRKIRRGIRILKEKAPP